jgi:hypothetical protein
MITDSGEGGQAGVVSQAGYGHVTTIAAGSSGKAIVCAGKREGSALRTRQGLCPLDPS